MTITLDLPKELEHELSAEAARLGLTLPEYAVRVLAAGRLRGSPPRTGAELVDHWKKEGLIGSRPGLPDAPEHARGIRRRAERRARE